jgi:hypothetical protein
MADPFNGLACIHKAFEDLTLHPETKIALRSCYHHAGKGPGSIVREFNGRGSDERRPRARIVISGIVAAGPRMNGRRQTAKRAELSLSMGTLMN